MVGNYGVPDPSRRDEFGLKRGFESERIHASALVVQDYSKQYSHWNAHMSLGDWLKSEVGSQLFRSPACLSCSTLWLGNSWPNRIGHATFGSENSFERLHESPY
jgi:hypothetical protein